MCFSIKAAKKLAFKKGLKKSNFVKDLTTRILMKYTMWYKKRVRKLSDHLIEVNSLMMNGHVRYRWNLKRLIPSDKDTSEHHHQYKDVTADCDDSNSLIVPPISTGIEFHLQEEV